MNNGPISLQVPPKSIAESYVPRSIDGVPDIRIFEVAMARKENILIEGPTGAGKSMSLRAFAAAKGLPLVVVPCNIGLEPTQLYGGLTVNENKKDPSESDYVWVDGVVTQVVRNGGVLVFEEVNAAPAGIMTSAFGLLDSSRELVLLAHNGERVPAHPDLLIAATMNPDYEGTAPLSPALRNRFQHPIEWGYLPETEEQLVPIAKLREMAARLRNSELSQPTSTNMLQDVVRQSEIFGVDYALGRFVQKYPDEESRGAVRAVLKTFRMGIAQELRAYHGLEEAESAAEPDSMDAVAEVLNSLDTTAMPWAGDVKKEVQTRKG